MEALLLDENEAIPSQRAPQHSPSLTETTSNTSTCSPSRATNITSKSNRRKYSDYLRKSPSSSSPGMTKTSLPDRQTSLLQSHPEHHDIKDASAMANQSSKTESTAATSISENTFTNTIRQDATRRQSSFSCFVAHAKNYWNELGTEARRTDSLTPHQDISLYPILPTLNDSFNDNENDLNHNSSTTRKPSKNTLALESFQRSHEQQLLKNRKQQHDYYYYGEKKFDPSSQDSSPAEFTKYPPQQAKLPSTTNQISPTAKQEAMTATQSQNRALSKDDDTEDEPTIFELFEQRRRARRLAQQQQEAATEKGTDQRHSSSQIGSVRPKQARDSAIHQHSISKQHQKQSSSSPTKHSSKHSATKFELYQQKMKQENKQNAPRNHSKSTKEVPTTGYPPQQAKGPEQRPSLSTSNQRIASAIRSQRIANQQQQGSPSTTTHRSQKAPVLGVPSQGANRVSIALAEQAILQQTFAKKKGSDLTSADGFADTEEYPSQHAKDIHHLTTRSSQGSDAAAAAVTEEQSILKQGNRNAETRSGSITSSLADVVPPPTSQLPASPSLSQALRGLSSGTPSSLQQRRAQRREHRRALAEAANQL